MANFTQLESYAQLEYAYNQTRTITRLRSSKGVCVGLVLLWLREKTTTTSRFGGISPSMFCERGVPIPGSQQARNTLSTQLAAELQAVHEQPGKTIEDVFQRAGLTLIRASERDASSAMGTTRTLSREVSCAADPVDAIADAVDITRLQPGCGLTVSVLLWDGARRDFDACHLVGFYRSRGNSLYFFDPNCGVYKLNVARGFIAAWVNAYASATCRLEVADLEWESPFWYTRR